FFGLVVVFTMLSAMSFDPRMIWDKERENPNNEEVTDEVTSH
ncbi:MAG: paraquat-inducible protein A, partial [Pseudomonas sp.]